MMCVCRFLSYDGYHFIPLPEKKKKKKKKRRRTEGIPNLSKIRPDPGPGYVPFQRPKLDAQNRKNYAV
jgi:hypothetical protein